MTVAVAPVVIAGAGVFSVVTTAVAEADPMGRMRTVRPRCTLERRARCWRPGVRVLDRDYTGAQDGI
jgi:hypothetical protein